MKKNDVKENFWKALPIMMDAAHVRAVDLANALNMSKGAVSCWLNRKAFPEMDNIQKIADVLNCTVDDLLGNELPEIDTDFGELLVASYYAADPGTQSAVRKLLDIKEGR